MFISLLVLCSLLLLGFAVAGYLGYRRLLSFMTAPDDKTPSDFAVLVVAALTAAAPALATSVTASIKASLMGQASGLARGIDGAENDIADEMLAQRNPLLAAAIEFSPALQKRLKKSAGLKMALASLDLKGLLKGSSSAGDAPAAAAGSNHQHSFNFSR